MKKIDMSPAAITRRLRQVDELRELSLALMNAKKKHDEKEAIKASESDTQNPSGK